MDLSWRVTKVHGPPTSTYYIGVKTLAIEPISFCL